MSRGIFEIYAVCVNFITKLSGLLTVAEIDIYLCENIKMRGTSPFSGDVPRNISYKSCNSGNSVSERFRMPFIWAIAMP